MTLRRDTPALLRRGYALGLIEINLRTFLKCLKDKPASVQRDVMEYDVLVVGAGPAGLACAIRLKQLDPARSVCVLEKAAAVGGHALSGAVMEPGPLDELLPEWRAAPPASACRSRAMNCACSRARDRCGCRCRRSCAITATSSSRWAS